MSYHIVQIKVDMKNYTTNVFCSDPDELKNIADFLKHEGYIRKEKGNFYSLSEKRTIVLSHTNVAKPLMIALLNMGWEPLGSSSNGNVYDFRKVRLIVGPIKV